MGVVEGLMPIKSQEEAMDDRDFTLKREEIKAGFEVLGIAQVGKNEYVGADNFGSSFKRCSILKDVPTVYSRSTCIEK
jgi:hypothetical protein